MTRRLRSVVLLPALAAGFNALAASGCAVLIVVAPDRPAMLLAVAGLAFFGLAAVGFAMMLHAALRSASRAR